MPDHSNMQAADLSPSSFKDVWDVMWKDQHPFFRMERVRLLPAEPTIDYIARMPSRWQHHGSIWQPDGQRFDIWINWDDKVRIEHNGEVILKMRAPAGAILRAIDDRKKANGS